MVAILDRYILREVATPYVLGFGLFTFFALVDRLHQLADLVIAKGVPPGMVVTLLCLMLPAFLTLTLPMALLVATVIVSRRLVTDMEMTALHAAGLSPARVFRPFLVWALLTTLVVACITVVVNPWTYGATERQLVRILKTRAVAGIQERVFNTRFSPTVIYVARMAPPEQLKGVLVADDRAAKHSRIIVAQEGRVLPTANPDRVTLHLIDGRISYRQPGEPPALSYLSFWTADVYLTTESPSAVMNRMQRRARDLPILALFRGAVGSQSDGQSRAGPAIRGARPEELELHKRFALPFVPLAFVLIGFPLGIRLRHGVGAALAVSIVLMVSYYVLFTSLERLALDGRIATAWAVWLPNVGFSCLGAFLLTTLSGAMRRSSRRFGRPENRGAGTSAIAADRSSVPEAPRPLGQHRWRPFLIIDGYLLREYMKFLAVGLGVASAVFFVVDLVRTLDHLVQLKPPLLWLVQRIAYRLPAFLYEALPMIVLVSTVCLFVSLVRRHELDALKAAGVSLYRLCLPILVVAGLVSLGALLFAETLLPKLNARAQHAEWLLTNEPAADTADSGPGEWYRVSEERFLRARIRDRQERALDHAVLLEVNERFQLETRWDAEAARWISDGWEFSNGLRWDSLGATSVPFASTMLRASEPFEEFTHWENRAPATMSFREMREYVASRYRRGYDADEYAVDLYSKVSFPVVHLVMALFAIPCALAWGPRSAPALGIGIAIGVSLSYWVIHALALSLGKAGLLPPMLAAWTANIIFTGLGIAGFLNVRT